LVLERVLVHSKINDPFATGTINVIARPAQGGSELIFVYDWSDWHVQLSLFCVVVACR
jgi:hypothetical protein